MNFKPLGDSALLVSFGEVIDEGTNDRVHALAGAIEKANFEWLVEVVPAYSSLAVIYDANLVDFEGVKRAIQGLEFSEEKFEGRLVEIPVLYGGEHGPDLEFVAEYNGLTPEEVIEIHSKPVYRVYFLGFLPGFAYLGGMDDGRAHSDAPPRKTPPEGAGRLGRDSRKADRHLPPRKSRRLENHRQNSAEALQSIEGTADAPGARRRG